MALPTFRYPSSPAKTQMDQQAEPDDTQKKAALKRRTSIKKTPMDETVVDQRKKAGY